jgi:hypothetical protein
MTLPGGLVFMIILLEMIKNNAELEHTLRINRFEGGWMSIINFNQ